MNLLKSAGRLLLLLVIFMIGCGLIWHIGNNLFPRKQEPVASATQEKVEQVAKVPEPPPVPPKALEGVLPDGNTTRMVRTARGRFITTELILFNSGDSTLREASIPKLDKIAAFLIQNPEITLEIIGHTDNLGPEPVNQKVSAERAAIVMNYLASRGVDPSRLRSKGMGSLDPIESNDTQLGRQANRRIEFLVDEGAAAGRQ